MAASKWSTLRKRQYRRHFQCCRSRMKFAPSRHHWTNK